MDLLVWNFWTITAGVYLLGLAVTAAYYEEHPPTACRVCNVMYALTWPGTWCNNLFKRLTHR